MTRAMLLAATVLGSLAVAAAGAEADSVGTFQVNGTFNYKFERVDCPAGIPAATNCFHIVALRAVPFPGLGDVGPAAYTAFWDDFGSPCPHIYARIPLIVAGKGEIDLTYATSACFPVGTDLFPPTEVTVSGGTGRYAGITGSGVLTFASPQFTGPGAGNRQIGWTGTLNVPGLTFDTTPPQITGVTPKVVKTRSAAGMRVRYSVSANDAIDGPVPAACIPASGTIFQVGRTTVSCTPTDSSANSAIARFVITVKRVRR